MEGICFKIIVFLNFDWQSTIKSNLSNFSLKNLRKAVKLSKKHYKTEASGNITLKNVRKIAGTGVDRISVGKITHSIIAVDLKLEI